MIFEKNLVTICELSTLYMSYIYKVDFFFLGTTMKVRKGFVSNSSSSSFICDICGEGRDLEYYQIVECERSHVFEESCIYNYLSDDQKREIGVELNLSWPEGQLTEKIQEKYDNELPSSMCPCCQLEIVTRDNINMYMLGILSKNGTEVYNEIKARFNNEEELVRWFNKKQKELPKEDKPKPKVFNFLRRDDV